MQLPDNLHIGDLDDQHTSIVCIKKLHIAMIHRAICDLVGNDRRFSEDAKKWFNSEFDGRITYKDVCSVLQLKATRVAYIKKLVKLY